MTTAFNLSQLANNLDTSGKLDATDGLYGVLPVANGGTGVSSSGTNGNSLISNGTTWTSGKPSQLSTASGSAPSYSARAWVNFDGTGTPTIRSSGNVSSITDNGTGNYTVNFTTAMSDANYATNIQSTISGAYTVAILNGTYSTTAVQFVTSDFTSVLRDPTIVCVSIFR